MHARPLASTGVRMQIHVHIALTLHTVFTSIYIFTVRVAIGEVNQAIGGGNLSQLLRSLQCEDTRLNGVHPRNLQWYMDVLSKAIKDKEEVM